MEIRGLSLRLSHIIKTFINESAHRNGYHVERVVDYGRAKLDVFSALVMLLDPRNPDFFFVQIGANDGQLLDPIRPLVSRFHWRGVLVEPLPDAFSRLLSNYKSEPQLMFENIAVSAHEGTSSLWTVVGSGGLFASFDQRAVATRHPRSDIVEVPVETTPLAQLYARNKIGRVDVLVVDTEGYDFEVIKMALSEQLPRPRLIRYEHVHLSDGDRLACADTLSGCGYRLLRDGTDTIALLDAVF